MNGPVKKADAGIVRSPSGPARDEVRVEREDDRPEVSGRVAVDHRAADRAPVANLGVADERGGPREERAVASEQRVRGELPVAGEGADGDPVALLADVAELLEPADVDEHRRSRDAELHRGDQRMPSGQQLRVLVGPDELDRIVDRLRASVLERRRDHAPARAAASTARTMLWYPVQRQRLPSSACRISLSDGFGCSASRDTVAITKPGVQ